MYKPVLENVQFNLYTTLLAE